MTATGRAGLLSAGLAFAVPLWAFPGADEPFTLAKTHLLLVAAAVGGLAALWGGDRAARAERALLIPLAGLLGALCLSSVAAPLREARWGGVRGDLAIGATWMLAVLAVGTVNGLRLSMAASAAATGAAAVVLLVGGDTSGGTFGNPAFAASYLAMAIPVAAAVAATAATRRGAVLAGLAAILGSVALLLAASRAGWAAGLAGLGTWAVLSRGRLLPAGRAWTADRRLSVLALSGFAVVAVSAIAIGIHPGTARRLRGRAAGIVQPGNAALGNRLLMWRMALLQLADRPVLGAGSGGYRRLQIEYQAAFLARPEHSGWEANWTYSHMAHHDAVQALAEWGVVGTGILLWLASAFAARIRAAWRGAGPGDRLLLAGMAGAAVACAVDGLASFPLHLPACAVLLGIAFAAPGAVRPHVKPPRHGADLPVGPGRRMLMVVASLVLLRLGWEAARAQAADSLLGAGMRRVQAQDLAGARDAFGRAADLDPWNGKAWLDAGTASLIAGDLEGAVAALGRAEALSGDPSIPYNLGLAWSALDRPDRARASLARAVSLRPAFPEALTSLADFEWRERRFREAEVLLKRALRAAPDSLPARRLLGFVYYHQGMRREALDQFIVYALHEPGDAKVEAMLQRIRREGIRGSGEKKR